MKQKQDRAGGFREWCLVTFELKSGMTFNATAIDAGRRGKIRGKNEAAKTQSSQIDKGWSD